MAEPASKKLKTGEKEPAAESCPSEATTSSAMWGQFRSAKLRFPNMSQSARLAEIDMCYPGEVQHRPWFDKEGKEAITGADVNKRVLVPQQKKYMEKIFEFGLRIEDRSCPVGFEGDEPDHTKLLGGKQLAMAVYRCIKLHPENAMVQQIIKDGYPVSMRPKNTPVDVQVELRDLSN